MIYLDNNSTTRPSVEVVDAMSRITRDIYGNPSSLHKAGQAARHAIEEARERVAALVGGKPREIVFTSGGTEANNLAILGTLALQPHKRRIITTSVEHVSVHGLCERLARKDYEVTFIPVNTEGHLDLNQVADTLDNNCALLSVMHVNNETGCFFPVEELGRFAKEKGVPFHVDAVQTAGKIPLDTLREHANFITLSAHKIHGPKGVGALHIAPGSRLESQIVGGHQERDLRPGTENVSGIVGFGCAAELAQSRLKCGPSAWSSQSQLRDELESSILKQVPGTRVMGDKTNRIWNTTNIAFELLEAEQILIALSENGVCVSSGSACSSGSIEPSHVLKAMGVEDKFLRGAVRFSLSWDTTRPETEQAMVLIPAVVSKLNTLKGR